MTKIDKIINENNKNIFGEINYIGKLNEVEFKKLLKKLLINKFKLNFFEPNAYREAEDKTWLDLDALAIVNGDINSVFITEIKTKFSQKALKQLSENIQKFNKYYPELKDKKKYGIIAVPHLSDLQKHEILSHGFYPAIINENIAMIDAPKEFVAKSY